MVKIEKNLVVAGVICGMLGLWVGWYACAKNEIRNNSGSLRLGGYDFIKPLLVCDFGGQENPGAYKELEQKLEKYVFEAQLAGDINTASIYFRNLKTGQEFQINPKEKFYPASLRKVPLLMALYKTFESNPDYLNQIKIKVGGKDQNAQQEITPTDVAQIGKTYSLAQFAEKMIKSSDNNSAAVITSVVGIEPLKKMFAELNVPLVVFDENSVDEKNRDFITAYDYSRFWRVLYNATYLNAEMSERAMSELSEVDFKDGLVAGAPSSYRVAHKFGLLTIKDEKQNIIGREMHDCGVLYDKDSPYILCVMTKSQADIPRIKDFIKNVSKLVSSEEEVLDHGKK